MEDETLDLLAETANIAEANLTKQKIPKQALPEKSMDRAAMSKLWTVRIIQDLTSLNLDLTSEDTELRARVAALENESRRNNTGGRARQEEDITTPAPPRGSAAWTRTEALKRGLLQQDGSGGYANARAPPPKIREVDQKKARTVVVRIEDAPERQILAGYTPEMIVEAIHESNNWAAKEVTSARILQSEDILLSTTTVAAREEIERKGLGARILASSARVLRQTFPVMAYGFPKRELADGKMGVFLSGLTHMNSRHLPRIMFIGARLVRPAPQRRQEGEKAFYSVVVDCETPEAANEVVTRGIVSPWVPEVGLC